MADLAPVQGWYPDPFGGGLRFWDGAEWTDHRRQSSGALIVEEQDELTDEEVLDAEGRRRRRRLPRFKATTSTAVTGVAAIGIAASTLFPWVRGNSDDVNSFEQQLPWPLFENSFANGYLFLIIAVVMAALVALVGFGVRAGGAVVAMLGVGLAIYMLLTALSFDDGFGALPGIGIGAGLWLCLACAIVAVIGGVIALAEQR